MSPRRPSLPCRSPAARQRGIVLFIALIVLVALSLAGIALVRSVDTNVMIAGNLAFRQNATLAGDRGIEAARAWMLGVTGTTLYVNQTGNGYYANWQDIDFTGTDPDKTDFNWSANAFGLAVDATGNTVQYVIHRLCDLPGAPTVVNCVKSPVGGTSSSTKGTVDYGTYPLSSASQVYYRVTVRITGPRNTVSYVQAVMN